MMRFFLCLTVLLVAPPAAGALEPFEVVPDVVYGHKDGMALTLDVLRPKQDANGAGVLYMVSGGWYSRYVPPEKFAVLVSPLLNSGFTVFVVRHGSSPRYVIPEIVEDVRRAVRFVRIHAGQYSVDPDRLGVTGQSAGGHLSLVLGTTADAGNSKADDEVLLASDRVAAVVAFFPPTDVRPWTDPASKYYQNYPALRIDAAKAAASSPLLHVSPDDAPTLLITGDKDTLVPMAHSEKIRVEFQKQDVPCDLLIIPGAGHGFKGDDAKQASDAMVAWFKKYLAKP